MGPHQLIFEAIKQAPQTFTNFGSLSHGVYGLTPDLPRNHNPTYGFNDKVIEEVSRGFVTRFMHGGDLRLCGALATMASEPAEGLKALTLIMHLSRAGLVHNSNYVPGKQLTVWEASSDVRTAIGEVLDQTRSLNGLVQQVGILIAPNSGLEAARFLYKRINDYE